MKLTDEEKMRLREDLDPDTFRTILKCMQILIDKEKDRIWHDDIMANDELHFKGSVLRVGGMMDFKNHLDIMIQKINKGEKNA